MALARSPEPHAAMGLLWEVRAANPASLGHRRAAFPSGPPPFSLPLSPSPFLLPTQLCPASFPPGRVLWHRCSQPQCVWLSAQLTSPAPAATPSAETPAVPGPCPRQGPAEWAVSIRALSPSPFPTPGARCCDSRPLCLVRGKRSKWTQTRNQALTRAIRSGWS